jgi:hypothetical protein
MDCYAHHSYFMKKIVINYMSIPKDCTVLSEYRLSGQRRTWLCWNSDICMQYCRPNYRLLIITIKTHIIIIIIIIIIIKINVKME